MELGIFGFGYTAGVLAASCMPHWITRRVATAAGTLPRGYAYQAGTPVDFAAGISTTTHALISIPPIDDAGRVCRAIVPALQAMPALRWVGYLSTTGVYGDAGGGWVDETTPTAPVNARGAARVAEEQALHESGLPVHIFRIAGIYGPGRSALDQLCAGTARRIVKPGHVFSRIHVHDIARALITSMQAPSPGVYNLADDLPCPAHEVTAHGAELLGMQPPPLELYESIADQLSPMLREFYGASRRVANQKIKGLLGGELTYPTYREGLGSLLEHEKTLGIR